jgi:hypothetical protein
MRFKIGSHEFEVEGPESALKTGLEEFRSLMKSLPEERQAPTLLIQEPQRVAKIAQESLFFLPDKAQGAITLRVLPSTDQGILRQLRNTLLLILYGFRKTLDIEQVAALAAARAVRQSGLVSTKRLSHAFLALQKEGLALKMGKGKGTKYQLSQKGLDAAQELLRSVLGRANLA